MQICWMVYMCDIYQYLNLKNKNEWRWDFDILRSYNDAF